MSENYKCFTFIWKIKNFNFLCREQVITSPPFFVKTMGKTKWNLLLDPYSSVFTDCVACCFQRCYDRGPDQYELDYELSFLSSDGSVLYSEKYHNQVYGKYNFDIMQALRVERDEMCSVKKDLFIPHDTLTIRCRMWSTQTNISQAGRCFAKTRIETECRSFVGIIEKFSCIEPEGKYPVCIKSSSTGTFLSSMNLCVAADGKLVIEIKLVDSGNNLNKYKCKIYIKDVSGNKMKLGQGEFHDTNSQSIPLIRLKEGIMENKKHYLLKDMITIECKVIFSTGKKIDKLEESEYEFGYQDTQGLVSNVTETNLYSEDHTESLTTLNDDLISLFSEGILCDTKLKTATETFPAHTAVLSARSPVFKSMFTTDMKEKTTKCVDVDDLDADTVRRMLLFMYSDNLDDLQFESAKSLFFAADKYNICSLRHRCSDFMKQNLLESNCCEALLLADRHQDKVLKNAVQDYMAKNDKVVLFSDEWKNLEKDYPQLSIEILRAIYVRNRKS